MVFLGLIGSTQIYFLVQKLNELGLHLHMLESLNIWPGLTCSLWFDPERAHMDEENTVDEKNLYLFIKATFFLFGHPLLEK